MDENISKYLKTYGIFALAVVLTIALAVYQWLFVMRVLLLVLCLLLVGCILLQQSKGGGLVGALGGLGGDSAFGTSATPIKKFTGYLSILFLIMVIALSKAQQRALTIEKRLVSDSAKTQTDVPPESEDDQEAAAKPPKAEEPKKEAPAPKPAAPKADAKETEKEGQPKKDAE